MIKYCRVLLNNSAVTVVRYGDIDVQLPPIGKHADLVAVKYENGKYEVVNNEENKEEKKKEQPKAKRQVRKKPVKEVEE